jgi:hypothetical protein
MPHRWLLFTLTLELLAMLPSVISTVPVVAALPPTLLAASCALTKLTSAEVLVKLSAGAGAAVKTLAPLCAPEPETLIWLTAKLV